jgi:sugar lactone lactonase YvrE
VNVPSRPVATIEVVDAGCDLAESPLWLGPQRGIRWVDAGNGDLHALRDGRHESWSVTDSLVSAVAEGAGGDLILAVGREFWLVPDGPFAGTATVVAEVPASTPGAVLNDAKVGPDGRLWAGTVDRSQPAVSALWSFGSGGDVRRHWTGVTHGNGLAWNPSGSLFYFVDSGAGTLSCGAFDPSTGPGTPTVLLALDRETEGIPDGLAVDSTGDLWLAIWGGHCVLHLDASGTPIDRIALSERNVTSCAFVSAGLDALAVTTAADPGGPGGAVHLLDVGRTGLPGYAFAEG